jgi:hypothetical protein
MFSVNPFAALSASVSPGVMQTFVVIMILLVAGGTIFDIIHKGSAKYFFQNMRKSKEKGSQEVGGGEVASQVVQTAVVDVMLSGEFCNAKRRIAHLLGMYGFIVYAVATAVMVFQYPTAAAAGVWPMLWHIGALMVCVGGYWFWFFIRVDVAAEGGSPFRLMRADLFILSLLASTTLALIWSWAQFTGCSYTSIVLGLYLLATVVLFGSVPWSKFSHMFFKPAAALEKRLSNANGSRSNLPAPADKPETLGSGRTPPQHY